VQTSERRVERGQHIARRLALARAHVVLHGRSNEHVTNTSAVPGSVRMPRSTASPPISLRSTSLIN
jgi:hypothetical protein